MITVILAGFLGLVTVGLYFKIDAWRCNHKIASTAGFPTFYSPAYISDVWWAMLSPILVPILEQLPKSWTTPWLPLAQVYKLWNFGYQPYEEVGSDSFMLATPNGNMFWSCDNAIINQLFNAWPKCGVPLEIVQFFDIWGPTIGSVEGDEWKAHRKVVTAGFNSSMNATVWRETQHQVSSLTAHWTEKHDAVVSVVRHWTCRLALHVISCGFFNMTLDWEDDNVGKTASNPRGDGHRIGFDRALPLMLKHLAVVFVVPRALLSRLPFRKVQEANLAFTEVTKYFKEMQAGAEADIEKLSERRNNTILESIVLSGSGPEIAKKIRLPKESVLGNIFFTLMAGHETVGSTLGSILLLMAIYPDIQIKVQEQLDQQLGDRPPIEWTLEKDYLALQRGYIGAVQKETLCLYNPAGFIMRKTHEAVTVVDSQGHSHVIPANTFTPLHFAAVWKNPTLWKKAEVPVERRKKLSDSTALYFNPDRWLGTDDTLEEQSKAKGSDYPTWYAFGQGPRSCPGRAFAQVEMTSAMATLFKDYSLELVVDEQTLKNSARDHKQAWEQTRDNALRMMQDDIAMTISIGMDKSLPIRLVKRKL